MLKKQSAKTHSRNGSSKTRKFNHHIKWTVDNESLMQKMAKAISGNELLFRLLELSIYLMKNVDFSKDTSFDILKSMRKFRIMLGCRCKFYLDSAGDIYHQANSEEDSDSFSESTVGYLLGILSAFKVNLEFFEFQGSNLKGINKYLSDSFPEIYNSYCLLSKKHGFDNYITLGNEQPSVESMSRQNSNVGDIEKTKFELLELDENLEIEEKCEDSLEDIAIENYKEDYSDAETDLIAKDFFMSSILMICIALGHKIKDEPNDTHQIDEILTSFSSLMESKCKYILDSDGTICFELHGNKEFDESDESGLVIELGIFACYKINLEFLECQNTELEGLNKMLLESYPETYNAYCALTNQFGFEGTVNLGLNLEMSDKEMCSTLRNLKVEKWDGGVSINNEIYPEDKISGNMLSESLNGNEVVNTPAKKVGAKKPLRKRKSAQPNNCRKAKKLFRVKRKQPDRLSSV